MTKTFFLIASLFSVVGSLRGQILVPVEINGAAGKRINIVFLSEGYTTASMPNFAAHVNAAKEYLLSREPWRQYRSYCNIYRIEVASMQNGTDNGAPGGLRSTAFNSGFFNAAIPQLCTIDNAGRSYALQLLNNLVPDWDVPLVLVNDIKYGGSGGQLAVATVHQYSAEVAEHEIGHSFALLGDEYDDAYPGYTPSEKPNVTKITNRSQIKWNAWIEPATPVPTPDDTQRNFDWIEQVGLFEGADYNPTGWYRPHWTSMMRGIGAPCGPVNREAFILTYYTKVTPIDAITPTAGAQPAVNTSRNIDLIVTPKVPAEGPPLTVVWKIDDVVQADQSSTTFSALSDAIGDGSHTVSATVRDLSPLVRADPSLKTQQIVSWTFSLSNQMPKTLPTWRTRYGADLVNGTGDGMVNLIKYALGFNPTQRVTSAAFPAGSRTAVEGADYLTLTVPRKWKRSDVNYIVETGDLATGWNSGAGHTVVVSETTTQLVVRDAVPIGGAPKRFIRLRVAPN